MAATASPMSPDTLRIYGEALFGPRWKSELARALGVTDRTMRRWDAGTHPIPDTLAADLAKLKSDRIKHLRSLT